MFILPSAFCCSTSFYQTESHKLAVCKRPIEDVIRCLVIVFYNPSSSTPLPTFTQEQFIERTISVKKPSLSFNCQYEKTENISEGSLNKCPFLFQL